MLVMMVLVLFFPKYRTDGVEHVIPYASRILTKPERRYCVTKRELLAVVTFVHHFQQYILGRRFSLRTDHGSLTWLSNFKEPEGQFARWLERLQEYDFSILTSPERSTRMQTRCLATPALSVDASPTARPFDQTSSPWSSRCHRHHSSWNDLQTTYDNFN